LGSQCREQFLVKPRNSCPKTIERKSLARETDSKWTFDPAPGDAARIALRQQPGPEIYMGIRKNKRLLAVVDPSVRRNSDIG